MDVPLVIEPQLEVEAEVIEESYDDAEHSYGASYPTTGATTPDYPPVEVNPLDAAAAQTPNPEAEKAKKIQNALTRTTWGFAMVGVFIGMSHYIGWFKILISFNSRPHTTWTRICDYSGHDMSICGVS